MEGPILCDEARARQAGYLNDRYGLEHLARVDEDRVEGATDQLVKRALR